MQFYQCQSILQERVPGTPCAANCISISKVVSCDGVARDVVASHGGGRILIGSLFIRAREGCRCVRSRRWKWDTLACEHAHDSVSISILL